MSSINFYNPIGYEGHNRDEAGIPENHPESANNAPDVTVQQKLSVGLDNPKMNALLLGVMIADTVGGGVETESADDLLIGNGVLGHSLMNGYDFMNEHGNGGIISTRKGEEHTKGYLIIEGRYPFTDDFEMTIAVLEALKEREKSPLMSKLSDLFLKHFIRESTKFYKEQGSMRCGHGSFKRVFKAMIDEKLLDTQESQERTNQIREIFEREVHASTRKKPVGKAGNGTVMRILPAALLPEESQTVDAAIENAIATHHHGSAVYSSVAMALATRVVLLEDVVPEDLIKEVVRRIKTTYKGRIDSQIKEHPLMPKDGQDNEFTLNLLEAIDSVPGYDIAKPYVLNDELRELLGESYQLKPRNGVDSDSSRKGLRAHTSATVALALYLIKHHHPDGVIEDLKRAIYAGGDTDTLAAPVLGTLLPLRWGMLTPTEVSGLKQLIQQTQGIVDLENLTQHTFDFENQT